MRLACVFAPQIALQAVLRRCPDLRGTPVALTDSKGNRRIPANGCARVVTVSAEARHAGVRPGLTAAQAAAVCSGLTLLPLAEADGAAAEAALGDLGFAFAPRIESEPGRVFFEIGDLGQLYPSEAAVTQAIQSRALRVGLGVRVAIAGRKGIARVATRAAERAVVPTGREAAFLAPLPLHVLGEPLPPALVETFDRWGLGSVGALAQLPPADVGLRLGADGARLHQLARGQDDEPFLPVLPTDAVEEGIDLDDAIVELEPLAFVLRGLFDRVLARLGCRGLACAGITLRFQLESRSFDVRAVNLAAPTREGAPLLQLARLDLTRRPPDAPISAVLVLAHPARARTAQLDFLRPAGPAPDRLAATIARLGALCGPDNVGVPRTEDTWREEAVGVGVFSLAEPAPLERTGKGPGRSDLSRAVAAPAGAGAATSSSSSASPGAVGDGGVRALTIRRYRPPEEIEVMLGPDGPSALRGQETTARILVAAGPYRLSGEWWRHDLDGANGFSRDYWDVHASDGALYRLHHDRHRDRWFLDGYYD